MLTDPQLSPLNVRPQRLRAERLARLSCEEQNSLGRAGLQAQYNQVDAAIAAQGYQVIGTTEIIDVSGTNVTTHCPAFLNLLERIKTGEVQVVVVSEISRLARPDNLASLAVLDVFARHNCLLNAAGSEINFSNPAGFFMGGVQALMAGHSRMTLLLKVHAAKEINRRRGWLTTSFKALALGISWSKDTRKFFYNDQIHRVVEAFRLMDEERLSLSEIGRRIGVHPGNVRGLLENEIYSTGNKVYDEKCDLSVKCIGPGGKQRARPRIKRLPAEIISVRVIDQPAVSIERFQRVQQALKEVRLNYAATNTNVRQPTMCSVFGRCGFCGEPLYVSVNGKRRKDGSKGPGYYMCKSRHPKYAGTIPKCQGGWTPRPNLDRVMISFFQETLTNIELLSAILSASARRAADIIPFPVAGPEQALEKLQRRERRLLEMCESETITIAEYRARRSKLRKEIDALKNLAAVPAQRGDNALTLERLAQLVVRAITGFDRADPHAQKAILQGIFAEVFFREEAITAFRFAPSFIAELGQGMNVSTQTIHLDQPFRVREPVPKGHKRCTCCQEPRPFSDFYRNRRQCRRCFNGPLQYKKRKRMAQKSGNGDT